MTLPGPRCAHCGLLITIWQLVQCKNPSGHHAREGTGVTLTCGTDNCVLPAGHHGNHEPSEAEQ